MMERFATAALDVLAAGINAYAELVGRHPWVLWATAVAPALPALVARAIPSAILTGLIGLAASIVAVFNAILGALVWLSAWGLSMAFARAKRRKRALRRARAAGGTVMP